MSEIKPRRLNFWTWALPIAASLVVGVGLAQVPSIQQIPDGIIAGKADAKYGTYNSPVNPSARDYQAALLEYEQKAYGLSLISTHPQVEQAELVYVLEHQVLRLHREIADAPASSMTAFEHEALLFQSVRIYADVRHHAERLYENMIRHIDRKIPGPNGQQIRSETPGGDARYESNYRSDEDLTPAQRKKLYEAKVQEYRTKGGDLSEIKTLTPELLKDLGPYSWFEYVVLANGSVKLTTQAGHILAAGGQRVKTAGQVVFIKNSTGKFTMAIVTNGSGSYKPDLLSGERFAKRIEEMTRLESGFVVLTKGEPLSTQTTKINLKADGINPAEIKRRTQELENFGAEMLRLPVAIRCGATFL